MIKLIGKWKEGYAFEYHSLHSEYLGEDEFGRPQFDTKRSETGQSLYLLKYRQDQTQVPLLCQKIESFVKTQWLDCIDLIIPMPASSSRYIQPVDSISTCVGQNLQIPVQTRIFRHNTTPGEIPLKDINDPEEKKIALQRRFTIHNTGAILRKSILLIDDIYHTGSTANTITNLLLENGAKQVFLLYLTSRR